MLGYVLCGRCHLHPGLEGPSHTSAVARVRGLSRLLSCHLLAMERLVYLTSHPETVEQNSQSTSDSYDGALLCVLAGSCLLKAPTAEIAVRSSKAKNVVRSIDQHLT